MSLEIRLDDRYTQVELVSRDNNRIKIKIDDTTHEVDIIKVETGVYSVLLNNKSYVVELVASDNSKKYKANTAQNSYELEIVDAETRYLLSRKGNDLDEAENRISSPMPGKVVKIPVKTGEKVEVGQTVIIISAMKMESEYKAGNAGIIKKIHVKEGDTIEGNQALITIE
jgi:biotin carboxyl carrier protein